MNVPSPILKQTRHHAETLYSSRPIVDGGGSLPVEPYRSPHAPTAAPLHPSGETGHRRDLSCAMRRTTALHKRMRQSGKVFGVRNDLRPPRRPLLCKKAMPKHAFRVRTAVLQNPCAPVDPDTVGGGERRRCTKARSRLSAPAGRRRYCAPES